MQGVFCWVLKGLSGRTCCARVPQTVAGKFSPCAGNGLANQCQGSVPANPVWQPVVTLYDSNPLARTIGYVYSQWGNHSLSVVKQSIDNYFACFNVSGIFVDETATDPSQCNGHDAYYDQLYAYVKGKDPKAEAARSNRLKFTNDVVCSLLMLTV